MNEKEKDLELRTIINNYKNLIFKVSYDLVKNREEAENIMQETFLTYFKNIDEYAILSDLDKKRLLARIAINKAKDYLKSMQNTLIENANEDVIINVASKVMIEEQISKRERREFVIKNINELKSPYRELIYEYYINEVTLDYLAEKNNTTKGTIKVQMQRAKKMLKEKLEKGGEFDGI